MAAAFSDAAGVVAPSSGEGIYYAMCSGELAAQSALGTLRTNNVRALKSVRQEFSRMHGRTFFILRMMQYFWYSSDGRRERFVSMCRDPDVQKLTWESYLDKKIVRREPMAHLRVFLKDMSHLMGIAKA
jgi:geranylgeranyl diphosphate/geranylgeranyl-bacteriochlorophyllide a reductase